MLDLRTAFAASLLADVALVWAAVGVFISYRKIVKCTECWLIAFSATLAGHGLLAFRGIFPDIFSIVIANALLGLGLAIAIIGAAKMSERKAPYKSLAAVFAAFLAFLFIFGIYRDDLGIRALIINANIAIGSCIGAAYLAFPKNKEKAKALHPGVKSFLALALLFTCRFIVIVVVGLQGNWMDAPDWDVAFFLVSIAIFVGIGLGYMRMIDGVLAIDLKRSAEENALLLREVRHRSKNNLALISSLVSLQADGVKDPQARAAFDELQDRIRTISTVYRLLSSAHGDRQADAGEYIRAVTVGIRDGLTAGRNIAFKVEAESIEMDSTHLVSLGLIVNELATNAVKHAFPDGRSGTILIQLSSARGRGQLRVHDDGVGGLAGAVVSDGLGLTLINSLASQLRGTLRPASIPGQGTSFILDFPLA